MLGLENSPLSLQESSLSLHRHCSLQYVVLVCCHGVQNIWGLGDTPGEHSIGMAFLIGMAKITSSCAAVVSAITEHSHRKLWGPWKPMHLFDNVLSCLMCNSFSPWNLNLEWRDKRNCKNMMESIPFPPYSASYPQELPWFLIPFSPASIHRQGSNSLPSVRSREIWFLNLIIQPLGKV